MTSKMRLKVLAAFIRNQVSLGDRPPVGRIELGNEEASLCADALEHNERLCTALERYFACCGTWDPTKDGYGWKYELHSALQGSAGVKS